MLSQSDAGGRRYFGHLKAEVLTIRRLAAGGITAFHPPVALGYRETRLCGFTIADTVVPRTLEINRGTLLPAVWTFLPPATA